MTEFDQKFQELTELLKFTAFHAESTDRNVQGYRARDLGQAAAMLDSLRYGPGVQLTIGENPVDAFNARKNPYDFIELNHTTVEPGTVEQLRVRHNVRLEIHDQHVQPLYGRFNYFSLDAIGKTLRQGGSLTIPE